MSVLVRESGEDGAGLAVFAAKSIKCGEILFMENPLVVGPKQAAPPVICVECMLQLNEDQVQKCGLCGVPMCAKCVAKDALKTFHSEKECLLLTSQPELAGKAKKLNSFLTPLRFLLK